MGKHHYHRRNPTLEQLKENKRNASKYAKLRCLIAYSCSTPKCACCNEMELDFLSLDHINNDGSIERKEKNISNIYHYLSARNFPDKHRYQILCFNCNMGRRVNNNICPHKKININLTSYIN